MELQEVKLAIEALLLVADDPLDTSQLYNLLKEEGSDNDQLLPQIRLALETLEQDVENRSYVLVRVGSGYRFQIRSELNQLIAKLWMQRPRRYSRALLETLALIAYRQPITRGEIEDVRGVAVSSYTIRTLLDRGWVRELGTKDLPGRPMTYGTTTAFLDYFSLSSLEELPPLEEIATAGSTAFDGLALEGTPE